jgi:TolB-like protein/class 3 adenylate cyclase
MPQHRRLAAILFTDIVGYTALMQQNEVQAVAMIKKYHSTIQSIVVAHSGEILNDYGDGSLCSFPSDIDAVTAALEIQEKLREDPSVPLRIGLHIGEILFENGKVLGDGVNVASRIQSLGQANTILLSSEIKTKIGNHPEFKCNSLGYFEFKNVTDPFEVFALSGYGLFIPKKEEMKGKLKESQKKTIRKNLIIVSVIALLLVSGFFIYSKWNQGSKFTGKDKSIAVLPFVNMSADKENEYFSDGMTEEITTQLSKIADLKVIARTSAMLFKGSKKSIKEIAQELGVSAILEGSVQKAGNSIRITAQLIDASSQEHIWADKFDRDLKNIFAIQSEVAQAIAYQLNVNLTNDEKKKIEKAPTDNTEAYQYYLQGSHLLLTFWETLKPVDFENSKAMFEKAISLDPEYAMAHAALADLYNTYAQFIKKDSMIISMQVKGIQKAWDIDSTNDYVLNVRGMIEYTMLGNNDKGFQYLKKALEINPNNLFTLINLSDLIAWQFGLIDEAKLLIDRVLKLDPLSAGSLQLRGNINFVLNHKEEAAKDMETALRLEPDLINSMDGLSAVYAALGKLDASKKMIIKSFQTKPQPDYHNIFNLAYAYAKMGDTQKSLELAPKSPRILLIVGKIKDAIKLMPFYNETGSEIFSHYLIYNSNLQEKEFEPIKNDPDFLRIMERSKLKYEENKRKYSVMDIINRHPSLTP